MNSLETQFYYHLVGKVFYNDYFALERIVHNANLELKHIFDSIDESEIIICGDSVISYADKDEKQESVAKLILNNINGCIYNFSGGSFSSNLFIKLFNQCPKSSRIAFHNKIVIYEINLRSFSDEWFLRPSYSFEHIQAYFDNTGYKLLESIYSSELDNKTKLFYNTKIDKEAKTYDKFQNLDTLNDIFNYFKQNCDDYNSQFYFYYGYSFKKLKERVCNLLQMLEFFKENHCKVIYYFTPLNYEFIDKTLGDVISRNINYIEELIRTVDFNASILNFINLCDNDVFLDKEHLKYKGREKLASSIANYLKPCLFPSLKKRLIHCQDGFIRQITPERFRMYSQFYQKFSNLPVDIKSKFLNDYYKSKYPYNNLEAVFQCYQYMMIV